MDKITAATNGTQGKSANLMTPTEMAELWIKDINQALLSGNAQDVENTFRADGFWRNVVGIGDKIYTLSGASKFAERLLENARETGFKGFSLAPDLLPIHDGEVAGESFFAAFLRFETNATTGIGYVRLQAGSSGNARAWTLMTTIDTLKGHDLKTEKLKRTGGAYERDWSGPNWAERRKKHVQYDDHDPEVLIVGGGHAGLTLAAWLNALNIENLVIDKLDEVGDVWRNRYNSLKLHSPTDAIHMPFMPFPEVFPKYIPKDKVANWFQDYVDAMEIDYWPKTAFEGATYDEKAKVWTAKLRKHNNYIKTVKPKHIVMATSQIGEPFIPTLETIENFSGPVVHSSRFAKAAEWAGKNVAIFGTGTSAHDIAQELHAYKANVTMVQRGETEILQIEKSAHLYLDDFYTMDGPPIVVRDLIAISLPIPLMLTEHKKITKIARNNDKELLARLEKVGFRTEGEGTGWVHKFMTKRGGYYFDVGCSELIANGEIKILQMEDIDSFQKSGIKTKEGKQIPLDLVVLATGFHGFDDSIPGFFGKEVADRLGSVWNISPDIHEINNMWTSTPQPGLWFAGGSFVHSRIYAKHIALQIKMQQLGV